MAVTKQLSVMLENKCGALAEICSELAKCNSVVNTLTYYAIEIQTHIWHGDRGGCYPVPRSSPYRILLSKPELDELSRRAEKYTLPYFQVVRAKIVLLAAQGLSNDEIGARLDTRREIVSMWRKRFFEERLAGLEERPRPGRPRVFPPRVGRED